MLSNTKWRVFAFNRTTGAPVTGDAANITAKISIDYGSRTALSDVNPTEAEDGYYYFDLTEIERTGTWFELYPESSTSGVQVIGVPGYISNLRLDSASTVTISADDVDAAYGKVIAPAGNGFLIAGDRINVTADLVVASSAALEMTGDSISATIDNISSTAYDAVISSGTGGRHTVKAVHISGGSDGLSLEGSNTMLVVDAVTVFGADAAINCEGTGILVVRCGSIGTDNDFVLDTGGCTIEIHADFVYRTSGAIGFSAADSTVRIYGATITNNISISNGTLELFGCTCLGTVTRTGGTLRYDSLTQFRGTVTGTISPTSLPVDANVVDIDSDVVDEIAAAAGLGSGSGVRSIVVTVEDEDENAVTGARVQVLTSGGQSTGQAPVTGLAGTVTLVLNDGSYLLRVLPPSNFDAPADTALTVTS